MKERDRRWKRIRDLMQGRGLEYLIVFALKGREHFAEYITNDRPGGIVFFSRDFEVVYLAQSLSDVASDLDARTRGEETWIGGDFRLGATASGLVELLAEKHLEHEKIGIVGLQVGSTVEPEGYVPYATWARVLNQFPNLTFEDVTAPFMELMLVKSEEELRLVRRSAEVGEEACIEIISKTHAGASESEIYSAAMNVLFRNRCLGNPGNIVSPMILHSGKENPSWGIPRWLFRAQEPRALERGDVLVAEIFPTIGGMESQQQLSVALDPIGFENRVCASVAEEIYQIGLEKLKPGVKFSSVAEAMEEPLREKGFWHLTPLIHSLNPMCLSGESGVGLEKLKGIERYRGVKARKAIGGDVVVEEGMVFELEPNASLERHRVNIGGTVIVTSSSAEELNHVCSRVQKVS